jgi:hypothetical protein
MYGNSGEIKGIDAAGVGADSEDPGQWKRVKRSFFFHS